MIAKHFRSTLLLGISLFAASASAQSLSGTMSFNVIQTDPNISTTANSAGVSSNAKPGQNDSHSITIVWKIVVSCTMTSPNTFPPSNLTGTYSLASHADSGVSLAGVPPPLIPSGSGTVKGDIANATAHTTLSRGVNPVQSQLAIDAPPQTKTQSGTVEWSPTDDRFTFEAFLVCESATPTTSAKLDPFPSSGGGGRTLLYRRHAAARDLPAMKPETVRGVATQSCSFVSVVFTGS